MLAKILDCANIQIVIVRAMTAKPGLVAFRKIEGFPLFVVPGALLNAPNDVIPNLKEKLRD